MMIRRAAVLGAAAVLAASMVGTGAVSAEKPTRDAGITDVVIVPGQTFGGTPYQPLAATLRDKGYRTHVLELVGTELREDPAKIGAAVDRIRADRPSAKIALVGHSIGGLTARWYLKELGGASKVAAYIAVGAPQYGSMGGCSQRGQARLVCPGTDYITQVNAGDDTPGDTAYFGIRSEREWASGHLDGGQCRVTPVRGYSPLPDVGVEHMVETIDPAGQAAIATALSGRCDGEFVDEKDGVITYKSSEFPGGYPDVAAPRAK